MREVFAANLVFVYLIYGFAFISMGLVLSVLVRTPLRLPTLGMLWLLAGFGLLHGLGEWADMAVLIKQEAGDPGAAAAIEFVGLLLFAASFALLAQFGVDLLASFAPRLRLLRLLPVVLLGAWAALTLQVGSAIGPAGSPAWLATSEALVRYLLGLPGAILTAFVLAWLGLRWSGPRASHIARYMLGCSIAFSTYALLTGLVPPQAPFFPASALNADSFFRIVGTPVQVWRALAALAVGAIVAETFIVEASRVMESTRSVLATLNESLRAMVSEADLANAIGLVVERARSLLGTDTSFLSLVSSDERHLEMAASAGVRTEALRHLRLELEEGLAGVVVRTGRPAVVESYVRATGLLNPPVRVVRAEGLASGIAAPLVKEGKLLGVLYVFNRRLTRFTQFDVDLMATFAGEASIAIDRARLLADLRQERQRLAAALEQLREMERQREEFISVVAHDLRGPIQVIGGFAQLLRRLSPEQHGDEKEERALRNIASSADRLQRMVSDLLDASRLEARRLELRHEPIDVGELVCDVVERNAHLAGGHKVQVDLRGSVPPVWADPGRVEQILTNLLSNAAKYSRPDTPIVVTVAAQPAEDPREALVSVTDLGGGIAPEEIPRLFSRFHRAASAYETGAPGLGLGLYIAKGLVEAHGGRIWVTSDSGTTTFFFTLPVASAR